MAAVTFYLDLDEASTCLKRICDSFGFLPTSVHHGSGNVRFPLGWCRLKASGRNLTVTIEAEDTEELNRIVGAVKMRANRIAKRTRRRLVHA